MTDTSRIFQLCLKAAPYLMGNTNIVQPQSTQKPFIDYTQKDMALTRVKSKMGSVIVLLGSRDTGKTQLSYRLAEFLGRPTFAISPQQRPPSWITKLTLEDLLTKVPRKSTLILDDLPAYMNNRSYNDALVQMIERIIPMVRHEPHPPDYPVGEVHLIFASQSAAQADRYILDCDLAFFKPLGLLLQDVERPGIARIYKTMVDPLFEGKDDDYIHSHAFMLSRTFKGLIDFKQVT